MRATLFVVGLAVLGVLILARDLSQPDAALLGCYLSASYTVGKCDGGHRW